MIKFDRRRDSLLVHEVMCLQALPFPFFLHSPPPTPPPPLFSLSLFFLPLFLLVYTPFIFISLQLWHSSPLFFPFFYMFLLPPPFWLFFLPLLYFFLSLSLLTILVVVLSISLYSERVYQFFFHLAMSASLFRNVGKNNRMSIPFFYSLPKITHKQINKTKG